MFRGSKSSKDNAVSDAESSTSQDGHDGSGIMGI
jgi:hypothetical protein